LYSEIVFRDAILKTLQTSGTGRICAIVALALMTCGPFQLHADGTYHEKLVALDERLASDPADATAWFQRGCLCLSTGDWQVALAGLEKTDRLAPGRFATDLPRGQALAAGGHFEMARTVLADFIAAHPDHAGALAARARVLSRLGRIEDSAADYRAALGRMPDAEPDFILEVADAMAKRGLNNEALAVIDAGIKRLGQTPSLVLKAVEMEMAAAQFDAALRRVDAVRKAAARPEPWMVKRASTLAQAGRVDASRAAWREIIAHLAALPAQERTSHSMSIIAGQARVALTALDSISQNSSPALINR
jgi:tetratricopeptide (TPR) repeat protein